MYFRKNFSWGEEFVSLTPSTILSASVNFKTAGDPAPPDTPPPGEGKPEPVWTPLETPNMIIRMMEKVQTYRRVQIPVIKKKKPSPSDIITNSKGEKVINPSAVFALEEVVPTDEHITFKIDEAGEFEALYNYFNSNCINPSVKA